MTAARKRYLSWIAILFADSILLIGFVAQAFVLCCLLLYGSIPLPKDWASAKIATRIPDHYSFDAEAFHLHLNGALTAIKPKIFLDSFENPVFYAASIRVEFDFNPAAHGKTRVKDVLVSEGVLNLPAIYSPSGRDTPILEKASFAVTIEESEIAITSFAALHDEIRLRGSASMPLPLNSFGSKSITEDGVNERPFDSDRFFSIAVALVREKSRVQQLLEPTIHFRLKPSDLEGQRLGVRITGHRLNHPQLEAKDIAIETELLFADSYLLSENSMRFSAEELKSASFNFEAKNVGGTITGPIWKPFTEIEHIPEGTFFAEELQIHGTDIVYPVAQFKKDESSRLRFSGNGRIAGSDLSWSGQSDLANKKSTLNLNGHIEPSYLSHLFKKAPEISLLDPSLRPYIQAEFQLENLFKVREADFLVKAHEVQLRDVSFDTIYLTGSVLKNKYSVDEIYLKRGWQWIDLSLTFDSNPKDYVLAIEGSGIPDHYNTLLPRWWAPIFREFDFENANSVLADFIIYGNANQRAADMYFGHARARDVGYKGVAIESGELFVRGQGTFTELLDMQIYQAEGWATGSIQFSARLDHIRGPESVRFNLESYLSLTDAKQLFDQNIREILSDFELDGHISSKIESAIFTPSYPENKGLSYVDLSAYYPSALKYNNLPLEGLSFELHGRDGVSYLRDMEFGFLGGTAHADADIRMSKGTPPSITVKATIEDADQQEAIDLIASLGDKEEIKDDTNDSSVGSGTSLVNLELHSKGPVDDLYGHWGQGTFTVEDENLAKIQPLGAVSRLLTRAGIGGATISLTSMAGQFTLDRDLLNLDSLKIWGPRTRIDAPGKLNLIDHSLTMRVSVDLFGAASKKESALGRFGSVLSAPFRSLLEFEVTGTLQEQKWRSIYDPRTLIPQR